MDKVDESKRVVTMIKYRMDDGEGVGKIDEG